MSNSQRITAIIGEGELLDSGCADDPEQLVRRIGESDDDYGYVILRIARDEIEDLHGRVRVFASPLTDDRVERAIQLVEDLTPPVEPQSAETILQARRNARLRAQFMTEYPTLTSEQIAEQSGSRAANRAAAANRWRSQGLIFAVRYRNELRYPAFQFGDDGRPRAEMQAVLSVFAERHASDWQIALWFTSVHPRAGSRPVEVLYDEPQLVELLARQSLDIQQ